MAAQFAARSFYTSQSLPSHFFRSPTLNNIHTAEFMLEGEIDCIAYISIQKKPYNIKL